MPCACVPRSPPRHTRTPYGAAPTTHWHVGRQPQGPLAASSGGALTGHAGRIGSYAEEDATRAYDCADQAPSATSRARPSASCLCQWVRSGRSAAARANSTFAPALHSSLHTQLHTACVQLYDLQRNQAVGYFASEARRSQGVRLCGCAGTPPRCQAQLPGRDHQRDACVSGRGAEEAQQHYLAAPRRPLGEGQLFIPCAADGPTDQAAAVLRVLCLLGDAARAYDCAAVQAHGPGAKRNFPVSELPVTVGEERILQFLHERARRTPECELPV
jgi:hypothetical protein